MTRTKERLTPVEMTQLAKDLAAARKPGAAPYAERSKLIHDGGGLYLVIDKRGPSASWVFRYMIDRRARTLGIGPFPTIGLADARDEADKARRSLKLRQDPLDARVAQKAAKEAGRAAAREAAAKAMTFKRAAESYIKSHRDGWRNAKHADQWTSTLETYAYPIIGDLPVSAIDVGLVMRVLEQDVPAGGKAPARLWIAKPETASRLRGRLEAVLGWATARGLRDGDNPAVWKGRLQHQLPARGKVKRVEHHAALPYAEMAKFMVELQQQEGTSARALEFAILTAARTGEVLGAQWGEMDEGGKVWVIPAARMKGGREHRVPLSERALEIIAAVKPSEAAPDAYVFPGAKAGRPLSNMALLMLMRRMGREDLTAHGFRSSFRDWGSETTHYPAEVLEMALAHAVGDKVEAAYRRGDLFERRRAVMTAWAKWCAEGPPAGDNVTDIQTARGAA
jgi:integrase